ncbi:MAG: TolC family protein [Gemmatimonadales bacterium]|nr:TolC family protein [Gemmatimonadales bacterium]
MTSTSPVHRCLATMVLTGLMVMLPGPDSARAQIPVDTQHVASQHGQASGDTLRLADALQMVRSANPLLAAARLEADAAAERIRPAGALPDPELSFGLIDRPIGNFNADERMTMNEVKLSQRFPWPGKRGLAREEATLRATAEEFMASETAVTLVSRTKERYYELAVLDRTLAVLERSRDLMRNWVEVAQALYAVGERPQQDLFQGQVAVARLSEEMIVIQQARVTGAARLNALLGRSATTTIGPLDLPAISEELPTVDSLLVIAMARRPALRAAVVQQQAAAAGVRRAAREFYPDVTIGVSYGQRQNFDDMASLMVGINLPVRTGSRQQPLRREMEALELRAAALAHDLQNNTAAELAEQRAAAEQARALHRLYATAILPQAEAAVAAAVSAYRVGQVDFLTLIDNQMTVNRYQIELLRISARFHQAVAGLDALLGSEGVTP